MNSGKLKRRVEVQALTQTSTDMGGFADTWSTVTTIWAQVEEETGTRALEFLATKNERPYTVKLRYDIDLNPNTNRFVYGTKILTINSILTDQDKFRNQVVSASEKIEG